MRHFFYKVFYANFRARTYVHRFPTVVLLRSGDYGVGSVFNVKEFPRCRSVSPHGYLARSVTLSVYTLLNERGYGVRSMRAELIPRPVEVSQYEIHCIDPILGAVCLAHR